MNKSFKIFSDKDICYSFLFPMEKLYESYVAQKLKEYSNEYDWTVYSQDKRYSVFNNPKAFYIIPDIFCSRKSENETKAVIMDTKWKKLSDSSDNYYNIKREDIYQMYIYSNKYKEHNSNIPADVWLLYPAQPDKNHISNTLHVSKKYYKNFVSENENFNVYIYVIDIENIDDC